MPSRHEIRREYDMMFHAHESSGGRLSAAWRCYDRSPQLKPHAPSALSSPTIGSNGRGASLICDLSPQVALLDSACIIRTDIHVLGLSLRSHAGSRTMVLFFWLHAHGLSAQTYVEHTIKWRRRSRPLTHRPISSH
jgi:hypothetical protein